MSLVETKIYTKSKYPYCSGDKAVVCLPANYSELTETGFPFLFVTIKEGGLLEECKDLCSQKSVYIIQYEDEQLKADTVTMERPIIPCDVELFPHVKVISEFILNLSDAPIDTDHSVTEFTVSAAYVAGANPVNVPAVSIEGDFIREIYTNGTLLAWRAASSWVLCFLTNASTGSTSSFSVNTDAADSGAEVLTHSNGIGGSQEIFQGPETLTYNDDCIYDPQASNNPDLVITDISIDGRDWTLNRVSKVAPIIAVLDLPQFGYGDFDPAFPVTGLLPAPANNFLERTVQNNTCKPMSGVVTVRGNYASDVPASSNFYNLGHSLYINGTLVPQRDGRNLPGLNSTSSDDLDDGGRGVEDRVLPTISWPITIPANGNIRIGVDFGFNSTFVPSGNLPNSVSLESRSITILAFPG